MAAPAPPSFPLPPSTAPPMPITMMIHPSIIKHGKTHAELVQYYTQYYHNWTEQANQAKVVLASLPPPHPNTPSNNEKRAEEERKEKWALYYAGNSAALAHYHLALSNSSGGGVEPYARPSSPPLPPQMAAATGVGNGGGENNGPGASAAPTTTTTTTDTPATATKKKRWAMTNEDTTAAAAAAATSSASNTTRTLQQLEEEAIRRTIIGRGVDNNNGKSTNSSSNSSYSAAVLPGVGSTVGSSLYNKFVQEQASPSFGGVGSGSGMKRKFMSNDVDDFSFGKSGNKSNIGGGGGGSYYGPSSSSLRDDDYVPLSLDQPLGYAKKEQQQQQNKKKKMKKTNISSTNNNMLGFNADQTALSDRARRFQGKGGIDSAANAPTTIANVEKYMGKTTIGGSMKQLDENDYERMTVKGLCTVLEKEYLRLTSPPKAELVRPQHILEEHLLQLKQSYYRLNSKKGKSGSDDRVHNGRVRDYSWYCSQLKAIRQDLTVQRIINAFAVDVYETHAKMALEEDDINEYNQSQTQLKELYDLIDRRRQKRANDGSSSEKLKELNCKTKKKVSKKKSGGGKNKGNDVVVCGDDDDMTTTGNVDDDIALQNRNEFIAYRIIYYVFLSGNKKYEGGSSDIFKIMLELTPQQREDECIYHALLVRAAVADNNYHQFFQLQDIAPNMGDYLMDKMIPSVRQGALQRICKAYRPSVPVNFVLTELGFDVSDKAEVRGGLAWMKSCGCIFDGELLNSKDTVLTESTAVGTKKSSLI